MLRWFFVFTFIACPAFANPYMQSCVDMYSKCEEKKSECIINLRHCVIIAERKFAAYSEPKIKCVTVYYGDTAFTKCD